MSANEREKKEGGGKPRGGGGKGEGERTMLSGEKEKKQRKRKSPRPLLAIPQKGGKRLFFCFCFWAPQTHPKKEKKEKRKKKEKKEKKPCKTKLYDHQHRIVAIIMLRIVHRLHGRRICVV
jgi:hypothetical protein